MGLALALALTLALALISKTLTKVAPLAAKHKEGATPTAADVKPLPSRPASKPSSKPSSRLPSPPPHEPGSSSKGRSTLQEHLDHP